MGVQEALELLLEEGADIHSLDSEFNTVMHMAAKRGNEQIGKLLLEKGSSVTGTNQDGSMPLHLAASCEGVGLHFMELLLENGSSIDDRDPDQRNALHYAASSGHNSTTQFLLERGADIHATSDYGTALHLAAVNSQCHSIKLLLENGALVDSHCPRGETPLCHTVGHCSLEVLLILLDKGADPNNRLYESGELPLHKAVGVGEIATVMILLDNGADIHALSAHGATAFNHAAESSLVLNFFGPSKTDYQGIMELLEARGADTTVRGKNGLTGWELFRSDPSEAPSPRCCG